MSRENEHEGGSSFANSYSIASILDLRQSNNGKQAVGEYINVRHSQPMKLSPSKEVPPFRGNETSKKKDCNGKPSCVSLQKYYHRLNLKF